MGERYYCDRSFQDNMHNRKKHLYGVQHYRSKKAWFDHFRDERRSREDLEHRASPEQSIEEWLTRREKKRAALISGRLPLREMPGQGSLPGWLASSVSTSSTLMNIMAMLAVLHLWAL
ncbi:unnamed protein product [Coregonus sp. 'balchen']|nr:unnamed protein product [Coregonus sp. 'balchen']